MPIPNKSRAARGAYQRRGPKARPFPPVDPLTLLAISQLRLDGGTQPRVVIDWKVVDDYSDELLAGQKFPPITVFYDGTNYWVADGFHRIKAAVAAGIGKLKCDVRQGTQEDAQWFSFGANQGHGLRRTNDDKQRAVKAALAHPLGSGKSDRNIASHCGVDHQTVASWRAKIKPTVEVRQSARRTGKDGRTIDTAKIGKHRTFSRTGSPPASPSRPPSPAAAVVDRPEPDERVPVRGLDELVTATNPRFKIAAAAQQILSAVRQINSCGVSADDMASFVCAGVHGTFNSEVRKAYEFLAQIAPRC